MPLGDPYVELADAKKYLSLQDEDAYDDLIQDAMNTASREIEDHCSRQFNRVDSAVPRVFIPDDPVFAYVADFYSTDDLVIDTDPQYDGSFSETWDAADYELRPLDGVVGGVPGWPYYKVVPKGAKLFPCDGKARLRITAKWGWSAVPAPVRQAAKILLAESFQLKDAPLGVAGMGEFGVIRVRDSRIASRKIAPYVRNRILVG